MTPLVLHFSDAFKVDRSVVEQYGAFDVCLTTDLPLFIDPFLLFNSKKPEYRKLHDDIILYLRFLLEKSSGRSPTQGELHAWYTFAEVKQNWLGFTTGGNAGRGLGMRFARSLAANLDRVFSDFGQERVTSSSHLEKLCVIERGVGRDMMSDFTTNLIKGFLLEYTEVFAEAHLDPSSTQRVAVQGALFSYETETWVPHTYTLPWCNGDFILLTPRDMLTRDDTWISRSDLLKNLRDIPAAIENETLRAQVNNYLEHMLAGASRARDFKRVAPYVLRRFPELVDYYIRRKEETGEEARTLSRKLVSESRSLFVEQAAALVGMLHSQSMFYQTRWTSRDETRKRVEFFKDVIENKGGHKLFFLDGKPVRKESDVQLMFQLVWFACQFDVSREVNDGRGPADFKVSMGAQDKTLIEFKLATNTHLRRNLEKQLPIYKKASNAAWGFYVVVCYTEKEWDNTEAILKELELASEDNVVLIDARADNKPTGSKA